MKVGLRIGRTQRQVAAARLRPGRAGRPLAPGQLRRIVLWALPFPLLAALALHLRAPPATAILPLLFGAFVVLWQVLAGGGPGGRIAPGRLAATGIYPRGYLIAAALFWTALIAAVSVAAWWKLRAR